MEHKTLLSETNDMRRLMGLPLIKEQQGFDDTDDKMEELKDSTEEDYIEAIKFARQVRDWWKNGEENVVPFFDEFKGAWDSDTDGAEKYKKYIYDQLDNLSLNLSGGAKDVGKKNYYYGEIKKWVDDIIDEINDWFQNPVQLHLKSPAEQENLYFWVDPETDAPWDL